MNEWESCVWACVCAGALVLNNLRYDSYAGGVWAQGVGWFKCLKTTCGLPGFNNHTNAAAGAAVQSSVNQKKGSSANAAGALLKQYCGGSLYYMAIFIFVFDLF